MATLGEVAAFFGVAVQTAKQWRTGSDPLPGRPGAFDLSACARWLLEREKQHARRPQEGSRLEQLQEAKLALEIKRRDVLLKRLTGDLVDVDAVARLFERSIAEHNAQADQLKDRILLLLPEHLTAPERERILRGVTKAIDDLRHQLADAAAEWDHQAP